MAHRSLAEYGLGGQNLTMSVLTALGKNSGAVGVLQVLLGIDQEAKDRPRALLCGARRHMGLKVKTSHRKLISLLIGSPGNLYMSMHICIYIYMCMFPLPRVVFHKGFN